MSNALGRLKGTLLSGWVFRVYGLQACLWVSSLFVVLCSAYLSVVAATRRLGAAPSARLT